MTRARYRNPPAGAASQGGLPYTARMNTCDVAVVGAGSVGVAAALAFARAGRQVVLVDPRPAAVRPGGVSGVAPGGDPDDWDSRVFALSPASIRLLDGLGVWSAMDMDRVAPVYDMRLYHDQDGGDVQESLRLDAWQGQIERLACIVEGRHLQAALDLVAADAGRTLRLQRVQGTVSALSLAEGQPARLTLDHGEVWEAGLVVAADGARSALRDMAGLESRTYDYGQIAVVANFNSSLPTRDAAWQWFDADLGVMALLPLPVIGRPAGQGRVSLVWSAPVEWAQSLAAMSGDELAAQVARQSRGALGELQCITPAACFPLRSVSCPRVIAPGFVMIGDAAHVVHPMAGQGMNLGFGDVQVLADVLAQPAVAPVRGTPAAFRTPGASRASGASRTSAGSRMSAASRATGVSGEPAGWYHGLPTWQALRRYERTRREPVSSMQMLMTGLHHVFGPALPPPLATLRNLGWQAVGASGWLSRQLIQRAIR